MKRRFRILQRRGIYSEEVIFSYPNFKSLEEGLEWIRIVIDPYFTGSYGITDSER